jgi:hypothetical protein
VLPAPLVLAKGLVLSKGSVLGLVFKAFRPGPAQFAPAADGLLFLAH